MLRALFPVALFLLVLLIYFLWRRPPSLAGRRIDLEDLGIPGPAIIQFSTRYCAPCKAASPHLEAAATRQDVRYAQVDVGERPDVARAYGIRSVPTIAVAGRDGHVVGVWRGLPADGAIEEAARRARSR